MKKLMFAAAAMAAGVVLAEGEIVSANVVGYQTSAAESGFVLRSPSFAAVGGGDYDLNNFKLGAEASGDGTEQVQVLTTAGQNELTYVWLNGNVGMSDGWYDSNTWDPIVGTIPAGSGFLMYTTAGMNLTTSGEVGNKATVVPLPAGFSVVGNNTPVDIDIQTITLGATAAGDGTEQIQVLTTAGQNEVTYVWLNGNVGMAEGWYDSNSWDPIEATAKAGEAFLFYVTAEVQVTIPSAL